MNAVASYWYDECHGEAEAPQTVKVRSIPPKEERFRDDRVFRDKNWGSNAANFRFLQQTRKTRSKEYAKLFEAVRKDKRFALLAVYMEEDLMGARHQFPILLEAFKEIHAAGWDHDPDISGALWYSTAAHPSLNDRAKIACYPTVADAKRRREVVMAPGRFFRHVYPDKTGAEIQQLTEAYVQAVQPVGVDFIGSDDPDGWAWAYCSNQGFSSCMSGKGWQADDLRHPARFYARKGNGLALAIIRCGDDCISARCIVNVDRKMAVRTYGDGRLTRALEAMGYEFSASDALEGVECNKFVHDGRIVAPYLDGPEMVRDHGDYLVITDSGDYGAQSQDGYLEGENLTECDSCGGDFNEEDMRYSEHHGMSICDSCCDEYYTRAVVQVTHIGTRVRDFVRDDDVIEVGGDSWLDDSELLASAGYVMDEDGDWQDADDCVFLGYCQEYVLIDSCVRLDRPFESRYGEVDEWARERDTMDIVVNGETLVVHEDYESPELTDDERKCFRRKARREVKVRRFSRGPQRRNNNNGRRRAAAFRKLVEGYN